MQLFAGRNQGFELLSILCSNGIIDLLCEYV